jgi:hypothetical protein
VPRVPKRRALYTAGTNSAPLAVRCCGRPRSGRRLSQTPRGSPFTRLGGNHAVPTTFPCGAGIRCSACNRSALK